MVAGAFSEQGVPYNYRSAATHRDQPDGERHADLLVHDVRHRGARALADADRVHGHHRQHGAGSGQLDVGEPAGWRSSDAPSRATASRTRGTRRSTRSRSLPGWDGGSPTTVTVRIRNMGNNDRLRVRGSGRQQPELRARVSCSRTTFRRRATFTGSTITMLGNTVTIVLGTPSGTVNTVTVATPDHVAGVERRVRRRRERLHDRHDHRLGLAQDRLLGRWRAIQTFGHYPFGGINSYRAMCRKLGCGRLGSGSRIVGSPPPR